MSNLEEEKQYRIENQQAVQGLSIGENNTIHNYFAPVYQTPVSSNISPDQVWTIPFPRNPLFLGQDALLTHLHKLLVKGTTTALTQIQAISGLGGIGKTQLAVEYAYRNRKTYSFVFWIRAEYRETMMADFVNLASLLQLPEQHEPDQMKIVQAVKQWLTTHQGWLLIFDNVDDLSLIFPFVPEQKAGAILLTTRAAQTQPLAEPLLVEQMEERVGAELLLRRARLLLPDQLFEEAAPEDQQAALQICQAVGGLPLALDQAGAYIDETQCRVQDYLRFYQQDRRVRTQLLIRRGKGDLGHPEAAATTWALAFTKVEQASLAAADMLRACAFLDPDLIPEQLVQRGAAYWSPELARVAGDQFEWNQTLGELLKYALIQRSREQKSLSIHRLVQTVLKDALDVPTVRLWTERTIQAVARAFPDSSSFANWDACQLILPHAQRCADLIAQENLLSSESVGLLFKVANYLDHRGWYREAEPHYRQALHICEQLKGPDHSIVAIMLNRLADIYSKQGKYAEAEPLYQQALRIWEQRLEPDRYEMASPLNGLANLYYKQGKRVEAEALYQQALRMWAQKSGPDHPDMAYPLSNLASLYAEQRKYAEAEPLYQRALHIMERRLGSDHPDLAYPLSNLAILYAEQGKYVEAEPLYQRALYVMEQQLGPDHPEVANLLSGKAKLYRDQGKYAEAEPLYQQALRIWEQRLDPYNPLLASSFNELANFYAEQGKYAEAEPLYQQALRIWEQHNHPGMVKPLHALATIYFQWGKYVEAEPLYQQALHIMEQQMGQDHLNIADSLHALASLYAEQGKYVEAEPLYQRALRIRERGLGPEHPEVTYPLRGLAALYSKQGKYAQAEPLYQRALHIQELSLGPDHPRVASLLNELADFYYQQGKYAEAESLYQQSLHIRERLLGPNHPDVALPLNSLASLYAEQGKYAQAEPFFQRALHIWGRKFGSSHPLTRQVRRNYAMLLRAMKRDVEAKKLEEEY